MCIIIMILNDNKHNNYRVGLYIKNPISKHLNALCLLQAFMPQQCKMTLYLVQ